MSEITGGIVDTKDLELTINAEEEFENYAADEDVAKTVTNRVGDLIKTYTSQLEEIWKEFVHYDYMFRCGKSIAQKNLNTPMATVEDPKSNVGATMFFRQIMQSAAKVYALQSSRDKYWSYVPVETAGIPLSKEESLTQTNMLDTLVTWSLEKDKFPSKLMGMCVLVAKYGILFATVNWKRKTGMKKIVLPPGEDGQKSEIEIDTIYENRPTITVLSPYSVILDPNVDEIQDQECVCITKVMPFSEAVGMVENGYWDEDQFRKITSSHQWNGTAGRPKDSEVDENIGVIGSVSDKTASLLVWDCWVRLPIDEKGKVDQKKVVPRLYRCSFVGNQIEDSICVRVSPNDDPDDEIPIVAVCDYPDDPGRQFHISKGAILKNNYAIEVTTVNQMIDSVSLSMTPPTIERKGSVISFPGFGRGKRIVVRDSVNEDMREYAVPDRTQTGITMLQYVKDDSKMAVHTDPSQMGEGLGARASATEASGVMKLSAGPSVMNAQYVTEQLFTFLALKLKSYWQNFGLHNQVVQITDSEAPLQTIHPTDITGEFDVRVDVVHKMVDDILGEQKLSQDLQMILSNPDLAQRVDIEGLLEEYFITRYGKSYANHTTDADSVAVAQKNIRLIMAGQPVQAEEGQNSRAHLKIYRAERLRYRGMEEQFPQVQGLDNLIEQHEQMLAGEAGAPQGGVPQPPEAMPGPEVAGGGAANMMPIPNMGA